MNSRANPTIMVSPPTHIAAAQHPRRRAAHQSVTLLHSPMSGDVLSSNAQPAPQYSPSQLRAQGRESSGESSNADTWFDKSNNDVQAHGTSLTEHEPPYLMRNSSSSETPPEIQPQRQRQGHQDESDMRGLRAELLRLNGEGSSTQEYRGVIDDLTIENKKLKKRLKRYEKLHDAHLKDEKLFEVRVHGLPPAKKRELEETLRKFADSLVNNSGSVPSSKLLPSVARKPTASSMTSINNDSAYASISGSGRGGSSGRSGGDKFPKSSLVSSRQNIHSFLHDIPQGLLPQPNIATMSEREKKRLVVSRLEQMFYGKGAAGIIHQHSQQQEEVSQNAARADRTAMEADGQRARQEGVREAVVQLETDEESMEPLDHPTTSTRVAGRSSTRLADEQRPTRPLDLDPHRAQVPADNIRYMRHLGFSPLDPESTKSPEDGHAWIYLNLLTSMAQLHTINVTTEFIRQALNECSDKFEMSPDGRKVRWKGGRRGTRDVSESDASTGGGWADETEDQPSARKRAKLSHPASYRPSLQVRGAAGMPGSETAAAVKFAYTPMFSHKDTSTNTDSSSDSEGDDDSVASSPYPHPVTGYTTSGAQTTANPAKPKTHRFKADGPIVFYNNARFCTDLSGERDPQEARASTLPYLRLNAPPIGKPPPRSAALAERRGTLAQAAVLPEPMDLGDNPIPEDMELAFPPNSPLCSPSPSAAGGHGEASPMPLDVTGIGGVWPADNFAVHIQVRHARLASASTPTAAPYKTAAGPLPPKLAQILYGPATSRKSHATALHPHILSRTHQDLRPSDLPPALSFMPFGLHTGDSTGDDDDDDDDEDEDSGASNPSASPLSFAASPTAGPAPQPFGIPFTTTTSSSTPTSSANAADADDDLEMSSGNSSPVDSTSSLDLLAAARELNPEAIRASEREYDAHLAERLAEAIPARSSAATAGGGSGGISDGERVGTDACGMVPDLYDGWRRR